MVEFKSGGLKEKLLQRLKEAALVIFLNEN